MARKIVVREPPSPSVAAYLTAEQRRQLGVAAAGSVPPSIHGDWRPDPGRPDPVALLEEQNASREPDLVPIRHGRMSASAFTFYRGAARIMADDLSRTPDSGLTVQLCGDAHLMNFGSFASPERRLVFDLNDFDETLPGPFEHDVRRFAASLAVAAMDNGFDIDSCAAITATGVRSYREAMRQFAGMRTLDVWYADLPEDRIRDAARRLRKSAKDAKALKRYAKNVAAARKRDSVRALGKLAEVVDGEYRIVSRPPLVIPFRDLAAVPGASKEELNEVVRRQFEAYRASLPDDRRRLLERFKIVDVAHKVVGVGSVGQRAFIVLLQGRDLDDPLFLQAKEVGPSVLESHLPPSQYAEPGERVVRGQRLMQATSDVLLGWSRGATAGHHYYFRQLRDMKGSAVVAAMSPGVMHVYARLCGWTLARAHARSGDAVGIDAYLEGDGDVDRAFTEFALRYERQNRLDFDAFRAAIDSGRLQARPDL